MSTGKTSENSTVTDAATPSQIGSTGATSNTDSPLATSIESTGSGSKATGGVTEPTVADTAGSSKSATQVSQTTVHPGTLPGSSTAPGWENSTDFTGGASGSSGSSDPIADSTTSFVKGSDTIGPISGATGGSIGGLLGHTVPGAPIPVKLETVVPTDYPLPDSPLVPINKTYTEAEIEQLIDGYGLNHSTTQTTSLEAQVQDRMLEVMRNLDPAVRQQIGYQLRDFIIACSYDGEACDYDNDFEYVSDPDFGNCYTFNANGTHSIAGSGTDSGLRLIAFNNVSEYLYTTSKAGVRVTLHKQNYVAFPNTDGYDVGVGSYAGLSVQYNSMNALSHPYGNCAPKDQTEGMVYAGWYTYEGCFRSCFQNDIIAQCGCADSRFPLPLGNSSVKYCGPANQQEFLCYQQYLLVKGDYGAVANCTCTTGCEEPAFNVELSSAAWPVFFENFTTPMCFGTYSHSNVDCHTAYSENAVWIDISYDSSTYESTLERPVMSAMDLFHKLSGAVCLWLGISMIALMEIVELLSYICLSGEFSPKKSPNVVNAAGGADGFALYAADETDMYGPPAIYFPPESSSFAYVDAATGPSAYVPHENAPRGASLMDVKFCSE